MQLNLSNYLINNNSTKVSFFKHSYMNYNNFVNDTRRIGLQTAPQFGHNSSWRIDLNNYGDLISNIILEIDLPDISNILTTTGRNIGYTNGIGNILLQNVELRINSELIDSQNNMFRNIWSILSIPSGNKINYNNMIKYFDPFSSLSFQGGKLLIPLMHWFCNYTYNKDKSFIFPLATFNNQTVEMIFTFAPLLNCIVSDDNSVPANLNNINILNGQLLVDFITLPEKERLDLFKPHNYLIMQTGNIIHSLQAGINKTTISLRQINYLVSELLIIAQRDDVANSPINDYFNFGDILNVNGRKSPIRKITLKFDGRDKYTDIPSQYFYNAMPLKSHSNMQTNMFIHCIPFALFPEKMEQPSGVCNFSEIQDPLLLLEMEPNLPNMTISIFYLYYNILQTNNCGVSLLHSLSKSIPTKL